jgi:hypothetical protein
MSKHRNSDVPDMASCVIIAACIEIVLVAMLGPFFQVEKKHTIQHKSRICDEEGLVMIDRVSVTILSLMPSSLQQLHQM